MTEKMILSIVSRKIRYFPIHDAALCRPASLVSPAITLAILLIAIVAKSELTASHLVAVVMSVYSDEDTQHTEFQTHLTTSVCGLTEKLVIDMKGDAEWSSWKEWEETRRWVEWKNWKAHWKGKDKERRRDAKRRESTEPMSRAESIGPTAEPTGTTALTAEPTEQTLAEFSRIQFEVVAARIERDESDGHEGTRTPPSERTKELEQPVAPTRHAMKVSAGDANVNTALFNQTSPAQQGSSDVKTQYVLSGQPTGWAAMAKVVRDFDEEKVKDCKEDIDTLLVFAGLFSAVETTFLVEAFQNLSENIPIETLSAIRQLVSQTSSYEISGAFVNSKAPTLSPSHAPFEPSTVDIRVNILWFSSLLFSLITASLGILVKQWLREYLAVENPSPQARLRLRHLRYPQLARWQVFNIAAMLPLLLQLSLSLFFVGMCYFTSSVDSRVAHTVFPLVGGWAFCFVMITLLPLFFPRCPYRTTFLKAPCLWVHRRVEGCASFFHSDWWIHIVVDALDFNGTRSPFSTYLMSFKIKRALDTWRFIPYLILVILRSALRLITALPVFLIYVASRTCSTLSALIQQPQAKILLPLYRAMTVLTRGTLRTLSVGAHLRELSQALASTSESQVILKEDKDLEILSAVDLIQSNDDLLCTTIAEAVSQLPLQKFHPADILSFIEGLVQSRLGTSPSITPAHHIQSLKGEVRSVMYDIITCYWSKLPLDIEFVWKDEDSPRNVHSMIILAAILGASEHDIPPVCYHVLRKHSRRHSKVVSAALFSLHRPLMSQVCNSPLASSSGYLGLGPVRCELIWTVSYWLEGPTLRPEGWGTISPQPTLLDSVNRGHPEIWSQLRQGEATGITEDVSPTCKSIRWFNYAQLHDFINKRRYPFWASTHLLPCVPALILSVRMLELPASLLPGEWEDRLIELGQNTHSYRVTALVHGVTDRLAWCCLFLSIVQRTAWQKSPWTHPWHTLFDPWIQVVERALHEPGHTPPDVLRQIATVALLIAEDGERIRREKHDPSWRTLDEEEKRQRWHESPMKSVPFSGERLIRLLLRLSGRVNPRSDGVPATHE